MAESENYWDKQKSFWKTPFGIAIWILLLAAFLGGGLLALNFYGHPYPIIESFRADPVVVAPGGASNLSWNVIGADHVEVNPEVGVVAFQGTIEVRPQKTTEYRLTAINGTTNRSISLKIMVDQQ